MIHWMNLFLMISAAFFLIFAACVYFAKRKYEASRVYDFPESVEGDDDAPADTEPDARQ